jgi:hypothetical protein
MIGIPLFEIEYVKKVNGGWAVFSESGKQLSKAYGSKKDAVNRLKEIEYFKHKK